MSIILSHTSDAKRLGRRIQAHCFSPELVRELSANKESLVAVYRKGFRRTAEVIPDRKTYDYVKARTVFGEIKGLKFFATKIALEPYRNAGVEAFMAEPDKAAA